ncbi:MAG: class I SAM-dependent methyltransferase [Nitrospirae bacterium]|nr:class I SAM-dependent methyltransferase [Nitrospirota bacterium]
MNPLEHIQSVTVCDLCGADVTQNGTCVAEGRQELLGVSIHLSTVVCRRCRFIFQPERFSETLMTALYRQDTGNAFDETKEKQSINKSYLSERQAVISRVLTAYGISEGAAVLDVGGGRGECCQHLAQRHRVVVADATECDPADPRIEKVHGFFSATLDEGTFDVVVMNHVLEHVFSPTEFLAAANHVLKKGGILVVEVPFELYTPLVARHLGDWRHVGYFCRATLRQFLEKSGFVVEHLALETGRYEARRLPLVRAIARKTTPQIPSRSDRNSVLVLVADMFKPAVLGALAKRLVCR